MQVEIFEMSRIFNKKCTFPYCVYKGTLGLFNFPKDTTRKELWLEICRLPSVEPNQKICFKHFEEKYIGGGSQKLYLKQDAIPHWYSVSFI